MKKVCAMPHWAMITHPQHLALYARGLTVEPKVIPEDSLRHARAQGWIVIGRDSDICASVDMPNQSNPRRVDDEASNDMA